MRKTLMRKRGHEDDIDDKEERKELNRMTKKKRDLTSEKDEGDLNKKVAMAQKKKKKKMKKMMMMKMKVSYM